MLFRSCSGGAMSDPSLTTCRFNVGNNRRARLRIEAAAMWAGIVVLGYVVLCGNALAASTEYAVDGLAVGTQLNLGSASYQEYKCSPSDQFDGEATKSDEDLISRPIHSCIRGTEMFYISIVLRKQHFLIRRRSKSIYSDIRARLVNRHA